MPMREPRSIEMRYMRELRRVWAVASALISQGLAPLLERWQESDERSDSNSTFASMLPPQWSLYLDQGQRSRYNPLLPRPRAPRITSLSDGQLRSLWPSIDPQDVRDYAPWAVTRDEVIRIVFPGEELPASDQRVEDYVRRSVEVERSRNASVPGYPPGRPVGGVVPPVVLGSDRFPMSPPLPSVAGQASAERQLRWVKLVLVEVVKRDNLEDVVAPIGVSTSRFAGRELTRFVGIDLRRDVPGLDYQIQEWVRVNTDLITRAIIGPTGGPMPSLFDDVANVVEQANREAIRVEELSARLQARYGVGRSRGDLIARDQVLKLNGQITRSRQQAAGISQYKWVTSRDERVRKGHRRLNGTIQSWDSPPDVGGGRNEHPGGDYQCRCTASPVLPSV